jgi:hypothetical protein
MSRAVIYETFGGPEVLELREVPEPPEPHVEQIREAVTVQAGRHVHGKIVLTLQPRTGATPSRPADLHLLGHMAG